MAIFRHDLKAMSIDIGQVLAIIEHHFPAID